MTCTACPDPTGPSSSVCLPEQHAQQQQAQRLAQRAVSEAQQRIPGIKSSSPGSGGVGWGGVGWGDAGCKADTILHQTQVGTGRLVILQIARLVCQSLKSNIGHSTLVAISWTLAQRRR